MRNIMIMAAFLVGLGTIMAELADKMTSSPALAKNVSQKAPVEAPVRTGGRSLSIPSDARGHFLTEGRIDGQRIGFLVDTGASVVALNEKSAARFGFRPNRSDYTTTVSTPWSPPPTAPSRRRARGSPWSNSKASWCATSMPWCCLMRRCRKICSACRSCRN